MRIMNIVWPVTGLYFPLIGIWFYRSMSRPMAVDAPKGKGHDAHWQSIFLSATHCGAGCVIGDILGAPLVYRFRLTQPAPQCVAERKRSEEHTSELQSLT